MSGGAEAHAAAADMKPAALHHRKPPPAAWSAEGFDYGGFRFVPCIGPEIGEIREDYPSFVLMKTAPLVASYEQELPVSVGNLLELGIMKGGSCAFLEALLQPQNHLAIDIHGFAGDGLAELTAHVAATGRRFRADYATSQSDIPRILDLWQEVSGTRGEFDLVIDDASHDYELSLRSFDGLFPLIKPGGIYVLEDWGWAHWNGPWQDSRNRDFHRPALSNLLIHACLSVTGGSGFVESVKVTPNAAFIVRGPNPSTSFSVVDSYLNRNRPKTTL
ncbi:class I SAM-dependent methyltransferase [Phenylobacterium sp. VNQ135]|uniref:class I SAM-dependent methyltransferase n=1 Tax=Phenylobacterium sp. VNQ135 TaxID=3400922 RepID=UPI003C04C78D